MQSHITTSKLNANETALCGGFAGLTTRYLLPIYSLSRNTVTKIEHRMAISPLDVVKIRLQVQSEPYTLKRMFTSQLKSNIKYSGILQAFKTIIAEEGVRVRSKIQKKN